MFFISLLGADAWGARSTRSHTKTKTGNMKCVVCMVIGEAKIGKFLLLVVSLGMNSRENAMDQNSNMPSLGIATRRHTMLCNATSVPPKCIRSPTHLVDARPCYVHRDSKKPKNAKDIRGTKDIKVHTSPSISIKSRRNYYVTLSCQVAVSNHHHHHHRHHHHHHRYSPSQKDSD